MPFVAAVTSIDSCITACVVRLLSSYLASGFENRKVVVRDRKCFQCVGCCRYFHTL